MTASARNTLVSIVCGALIVLATVIVYRPLARAEFTNWDDPRTITENPFLSPPTAGSLARMWTAPQWHLYGPLTYTVWWTIDATTIAPNTNGGAGNAYVHNAAPFHVANIIVHAMAAVFVFLILRQLLRAAADDPASILLDATATVGTLLFALHPVQVESVGWISGMKDVLAGMLSLGAIDQYIRFARAEASSRAKIVHQIAGAALLLLALLSKPSAIAVPIIALAIDRLLLKRTWRDVLGGVVPMIVIAIPFIIIGLLVQTGQGVTTVVAWYKRPIVALDALAFYAGKLVWPTDLVVDYGRAPKTVWATGVIWWTCLVPIAIAAIAWATSRRRASLIVIGLVVVVIALAPVLGLFAFDFQEYSTVADHYLYLPMLGVALVACGVMMKLPRGVGVGLFTLVAVALGVRATDQTKYWSNGTELWTHTIAVNPNSWNGHGNLAQALAARDQYAEALRLVNRSLEIRPDNFFAHMIHGEIMLSRGDLEAAAESFRRAIQLNPNPFVEAHVNLAFVYGQMNRIDDAITEYETALHFDPDNEKANRMLPRARGYRQSLRQRAATRNAATRSTTSPTTILPTTRAAD